MSSDGGSDDALGGSLRRLSPPSRPQTRSPVDKIVEHEKALPKLPKRKKEGPSFTVVRGGREPASDRIAFVDFPNGLIPTSY